MEGKVERDAHEEGSGAKESGPLMFDFKAFREANVERCIVGFKHPLNSWSEMEWGAAAAGELGELLNNLKKRARAEAGIAGNVSDAPSVADCAAEIADVIIYLDLLAARMGIDVQEAIVEKFNRVSHRVASSVFIKADGSRDELPLHTITKGSFVRVRHENGSFGVVTDVHPANAQNVYVQYVYGLDVTGEPIFERGANNVRNLQIVPPMAYQLVRNRPAYLTEEQRQHVYAEAVKLIPCDPEHACATHGRCWTHSREET